MSKLSIDQHGIQVETHEIANVMSSLTSIAFIVLGGAIALLLLGVDLWIKIFGALVFLIFTIIWLIIYTCHSVKKPELLQSEKYRLEMHKIESGMIEDKNRKIDNLIEQQTTNILPPYNDNDEADKND